MGKLKEKYIPYWSGRPLLLFIILIIIHAALYIIVKLVELNYNFKEIPANWKEISQSVLTFDISNTTDLIAIVFGLTAGVLTLVGLVSLFISIDSQHKIQKARELKWEIDALRIKYSSHEYENIAKQFHEKFFLYKNILDSNGKSKKNYTFNFIELVNKSLLGVIFLWFITPILLTVLSDYSFLESIFIGIVTVIVIILLFSFYIFLDKLKDIKKIAELEDPADYLDGVKYKDLDSIFWFSSTLKLKLKLDYPSNKFSIRVGTPFEFTNFKIKHLIRFVSIDGKMVGGTYYNSDSPDIINISSEESIKDNNQYWYTLNGNENSDFSVDPIAEVHAGILVEVNSKEAKDNIFIRFKEVSPFTKKEDLKSMLYSGWDIYPFQLYRNVEIGDIGKFFGQIFKFDDRPNEETISDKLDTIIKLLNEIPEEEEA